MNDERCDPLCLDAPRAEAIRVGQPGVEVAREAAERASMFSDPTRLMLAAALGEGGERRGSGGRLDRPPDVLTALFGSCDPSRCYTSRSGPRPWSWRHVLRSQRELEKGRFWPRAG